VKSDVVVKILGEIFDIFGIPREVKTDNGPPFQSHSFSQFLSSFNVKHRKITPLWPRANAICERFMRNLNRVIRSSKVTNTNWKNELDIFLRNYRATPHDSTGIAPAELLFKTTSSTCRLANLNRSTDHGKSDLETKAKFNDKCAKQRMKVNMDRKLQAKLSSFKVGDQVLVQWKTINKSMSRYDPEPYHISDIKDSMITAKRPNHSITRNSSFFQKVKFEGKENNKNKSKYKRDKMEPILIIDQNNQNTQNEDDDFGLVELFNQDSHLVLDQLVDMDVGVGVQEVSELINDLITSLETDLTVTLGSDSSSDNEFYFDSIENISIDTVDEDDTSNDQLSNSEDEIEPIAQKKRFRKAPDRYSPNKELIRELELKQKLKQNK
jgi:hypothetical protein